MYITCNIYELSEVNTSCIPESFYEFRHLRFCLERCFKGIFVLFTEAWEELKIVFIFIFGVERDT